MRHLIIYAHPNKDSFNHQILLTAVNKLTALGATVQVRDLYETGFDPCYGMKDIKAMQAGDFPNDVKAEQEFIKNADKITFIAPIWWTHLPAIMKGYLDRVFVENFAYSFLEDGMSTGLLTDKKFGMINTMGASKAEMQRTNMSEAFALLTDKAIFGFCGSPLCYHKVFYEVNSVGEEQRKQMLEEVEHVIEQFVLDPNYCPYFG